MSYWKVYAATNPSWYLYVTCWGFNCILDQKKNVYYKKYALKSLLLVLFGTGCIPDAVKMEHIVWMTLQCLSTHGERFYDQRIASIELFPKNRTHPNYVYFKCEQCDYMPHCSKAIDVSKKNKMDISAIAGMSVKQKRTNRITYLTSNLWPIFADAICQRPSIKCIATQQRQIYPTSPIFNFQQLFKLKIGHTSNASPYRFTFISLS